MTTDPNMTREEHLAWEAEAERLGLAESGSRRESCEDCGAPADQPCGDRCPRWGSPACAERPK